MMYVDISQCKSLDSWFLPSDPRKIPIRKGTESERYAFYVQEDIIPEDIIERWKSGSKRDILSKGYTLKEGYESRPLGFDLDIVPDGARIIEAPETETENSGA